MKLVNTSVFPLTELEKWTPKSKSRQRSGDTSSAQEALLCNINTEWQGTFSGTMKVDGRSDSRDRMRECMHSAQIWGRQ